MATSTLPKAVAFLRVAPQDTDKLTAAQEKLFTQYAERHGFDLRHIEFESESTVNVSRIGQVIGEHKAQHFLVLSMQNVTTHAVIADALEQAIMLGSGAEIHEVETEEPNSR
ncbi:hypothetical protein [Streptomyces sp. SID9124]|uniref:hypothetical protein n=1 Tax=Streptomyces sp. SID9124 TaxID=2706108 RepID=UPI0013DF5905|nr:hypothetical protein [Streptomyces sp. SID9124]NED10595.1 hypothetical protein [Streptomyces sp. SID9124]